jgi:hypothetical protein
LHFTGWAPHMIAALACEKYGMDDEALGFVSVIHDLDPRLGGDPKPTSHIIGHSIKGRVMARRGDLKAAADAFEQAVSMSEKYELWLLTAFALRDLKLHVLDDLGHGDHGSRRLGAVLRRLTGSAASLSSVLGGLDAGELMGMAPPDASYIVEYETEDPAMASLRQTLQGMKLMALHKRAVAEGVSEGDVEDAMESAEPKAELIALLMSKLGAAAAAEHEEQQRLREELGGLRVMALHKRASSAGVSDAAIEEAMDSSDPKDVLIELVLSASACIATTPTTTAVATSLTTTTTTMTATAGEAATASAAGAAAVALSTAERQLELQQAATNGDLPKLTAVLSLLRSTATTTTAGAGGAGADAELDLEAAGADGCTALYLAANGGHADAVRALAEAGANVNAVAARTEYSALHAAAQCGHAAVVRALLEAGADGALLTKAGKTALQIARRKQHADVVQALEAAAAL